MAPPTLPPAPRRWRVTATAVALPAALWGCGDLEGEGAIEPVVTDSAGIQIVEAPVPEAGVADGWRIEPEPTVTIGEREGDDPYLFTDLQDAGWLPDGRIYVVDWGPHMELRLFDAEGGFAEAWGGSGQGPGEFDGPPRFVFAYRADSIAVADLGRISIFDAEGGFGRRVLPQLDFQPDPDRVPRQTCCVIRASLPDGSWLVEHPETGPADGGGARGEVRIVRMSPEGEVTGELGVFPGGRWYEASPERPARAIRGVHTGHFTLAVTGERILAGNNQEFRIDELSSDGRLQRSIRVQSELPPFEAEERRAYEEGFRARAPGNDPASRAILRDQLAHLPDRLPAFDRILVDPDDHLWLVSTTVAYVSPRVERALVVAPDGAVLGEVELPPDVRVTEVGRDAVLGVTADALGVPRVVVHRIVR